MLLFYLAMAHYSSQLIRYEDGDKRPLKSISMKPFVFALDAQSWVNAEDERSGLCITACTICSIFRGDLTL